MQIFKLSLFKHKRDTKPEAVERSWEELCKRFRHPQVRREKDGSLFSPARFEPAYRLKENVCEVSMLVLDIDHHAELETLKEKLLALDSAYAIYSTHSHLRRTESNPNAEPRFRVCLPLESAIPAKDFPALWQYARATTDLPLDESAKDASRMFYTPAIAAKDAPYIFELKDGSFLDWQKLPPDSVGENGKPNDNGHTAHEPPTFEFHEDRHAELCRRIEAQAKATGRGTYEMKCPAHNGNGDSSLFYDPTKQTVACLKKPDKCTYFEILAAFGLPIDHLPSREKSKAIQEKHFEFELHEKALHGVAGEFVRLVLPNSEADEAALLIQFLCAFGNAAGRNAYFMVEADRHYLTLFVLLVGGTGTGRKGTSWGYIKRIFNTIAEKWSKDCLASGLSSGEGLMYRVRDPIIQRKKNKDNPSIYDEVEVDSGIDDKRLLVVEGEFAQVLRVQGRESNTLSAMLRNFWDSGTHSNLVKNSPLKTTNAHVSIIGHITGEEFTSSLNANETVNGYLNRFLMFRSRRSKILPFGGNHSEIDFAPIVRKTTEAKEFAKTVGEMKLTNEAKEFWAEIYFRLETGRSGILAKVTQRASPYVLRIACIYALLDLSNVVKVVHLQAALAVWQYAENTARSIFGGQIENKKAQKLLDALRQSESGLTRTQIRDLFGKNLKSDEMDSILILLESKNLAGKEKVLTENAKKPTEVWFANRENNSELYDINDFYDIYLNDTSESAINIVNVVNVVNVVEETEDEIIERMEREAIDAEHSEITTEDF